MAEIKVNAQGKVTQRAMFEFIREELADNAEVVAFCDKKIAQLDARAKAPHKPRFNAEANEFAVKVVEILREAEAPMTNKEVTAVMADMTGETVSAQKTAAAIRRIEKGQVMVVDEDGAPVEPMAVELVITEGEKKADPRKFSVTSEN